MSIRNRELSQFGSFIYIDDSTRSVGIATTPTPYVGIGTTNPSVKFEVVGDTNLKGNVTVTGDLSLGDDLSLGGDVNVSGVVSATSYYINGNPLINAEVQTWNISGSDVYRLNGNVGIGTSVFPEKLTVSGNVSANQFKSTVASGTAPLVVLSDTQVTNLNASFLRGQAGPSGTIVGTTDFQILTNKTLVSPIISSGGINVVGGIGVTGGIRLYGSTSGSTLLQASNVAFGTVTLPAVTDTLVGRGTTDTLTNKTIAASSNTITGLTNSNLSGSAGISNANLANSTISGISLGSNLGTLTFGAYLSSSGTYNGSTARTVSVAATSVNTGNTIVARNISGDFTAGTISVTHLTATNTVQAATGNITQVNATNGNFTGILTANNANFTGVVTATTVNATQVNATNGNFTGILTANNTNFTGVSTFSALTITGNLDIPDGTIFQRPIAPAAGSLRYNTTVNLLEIYDGTLWKSVSLVNNLIQDPNNTGVFAGNQLIDFITITTTGNSTDFGSLSTGRGKTASCSSSTRGVFGGGERNAPSSPGTLSNVIDYITITNTGNTVDFGDLTVTRESLAACSNSTRGVFSGGNLPSPGLGTNVIDYITIATTGDATDFGDLSVIKYGHGACSSSTRGVFGGGVTPGSPTYSNVIDYITIATTGNATDFGDLTTQRLFTSACSNSTRGVFAGGFQIASPAPTIYSNVIDYITIASVGNATDFGDLTVGRLGTGACSSSTRGVFGGGSSPSPGSINVLDYVTIATTGNATDFGDLSVESGPYISACSSAHGGLS